MAIRRLTANNKKRRTNGRRGNPDRDARSRSITVIIYLLLAGISLAVFAQTIRYEFVNFDDDLYVYNAPGIQAGLTIKGIGHAFISQHARNWHPLTTLSHMLDCQLYSLNAGAHHATNIILHTMAVLLLFQVLRQMTGAVWKSAIVAALFAVHPLHVESVAWISERKDVLSAVFFLFMLDAYGRYAHAPSTTRYLAVVVLYAAGLMSKPMLVSVPIVLLLLDYWPLRRLEQPSLTTGKRKIAQSGNRVEYSAGAENRNIAAEHQHGVFPGNLVQDSKHHEHGAEEELVGDRIEVLSQNRLLFEGAREQSIETVAHSRQNKQQQGRFVVSRDQVDDDERHEAHPQQGELVGRGQ